MQALTNLPESLGFTSRFFELPGLRMHAAVAGPEDGPLVVLLHGFPEDWYSWRHQIGPLAAAGYRVVAPDQRGYSLTDKTPPYDIRTLVGDIIHLIETNGRKHALVAGHDWGAAVAWTLASTHSELVSRLAILNVPHPSVMMRALLGGNLRQLWRSWYILYFQIPGLPERGFSRNDFALLAESVRSSALPHTFTTGDIAHYRQVWAQPGGLSAMIGWYRALFRAARSPRKQLTLPRIAVPTVIIWGERDKFLRTELALESTAWLDRGRLIRFPDATHWVHEDKPDEVTRLLLDHFGQARTDAQP
jgi:epoxide hydrolase 4